MGKQHASRISVTVPPELLQRFDEHIARLGYANRSSAVQDAIQNLITESKWMCEKQGTGVGAIAMVYSHGVKDLEGELTGLQHRFKDTVCASMHVHLDADNCMEIIAVKGRAKDVRDLTRELKTHRGVKGIDMAVVTP